MLYPIKAQVHGFGQTCAIFLVGQVSMGRMSVLDVVSNRLHILGSILDE
jgi:hypothetical protein